MSWPQIVFGAALVVALLFLALYYGLRQLEALRGLRAGPGLPPEEARYERHKAWRRLVSSGLLLVLAGLLAALLLYLENPTQQIANEREGLSAEEAPPLTPAQKAVLRVWGWSWLALLTVLLAVVLLAAFDLWATRRYGLRAQRQLQADRRAMIERQVTRLRQERNGHV